ncbi:hypothetical protein GF324_13455, partial [bacterium]|nr:hypothetical protein [bacterium]
TIYAVGIGSSESQLTPRAREILGTVDVVAGHYGFIEMVRGHINPQARVIDDRPARARSEDFSRYQHNRVSAIVAEALKGQSVAVVSGGDAGIWGMAGVLLEAREVYENAFRVEVVPGIPSFVTVAARLGAPLQNGFTVVSIGDEDTPFAVIEQRLRGAALGGGALVLYKLILENMAYPEFYPPDQHPELSTPAKTTRFRLQRTFDILREHIPPERPMAIVTDVCDQTARFSTTMKMLGADDRHESIVFAPFGEFLKRSDSFRFFTTVIIGDATTRRHGDALITSQWNYTWKYSRDLMNDIADLPYLKEQKEFFEGSGRGK